MIIMMMMVAGRKKVKKYRLLLNDYDDGDHHHQIRKYTRRIFEKMKKLVIRVFSHSQLAGIFLQISHSISIITS